MDATILDDVHDYWFGDLKAWDAQPDEKRRQEWFHPSEATDAHIRDRWGHHIEAARDAAWDILELSRGKQVGLVILLDQFPRQIHRDSAEAFACDAAARAVARQLIASGWRRFFVAEQTFVMLPFEHSEDPADQDLSVKLYAERALEAPPNYLESCREQLDYTTRHRDLIRKFGRFPHRNAVLGRESTPEEIEFLKSGRGF